MIPLTIAHEIEETLLDYLTTTFNFQDPAVERALLAFLRGEGEEELTQGMFQGPYLHLRLPFRKIRPEELPPLDIAPPFRPYVHQLRAFERLTSLYDHQPQPTIVTTGTGSGKTECFLYPILDHCYARRGEPGIKAIILYPMNALASDQAARLARILWHDERLRGQVRAGIYIGGEGEQTHAAPGPEHLVDDRATLRDDPPDILLTNYKMLDFLLLRPEDRRLWTRNRPETLRYLVLDELHTYDGAQGSDVGCLVRRLKARLGTPEGTLCPVGTSATVTAETGDTAADLIHFAEEIFAEPFPPDAVIGEERLGLVEFLPGPASAFDLPADVAALRDKPGERPEEYLRRQAGLWFGEEVTGELDPFGLGDALKRHSFLRALLTVLGDRIVAADEVCRRLARWEPEFAALPPADQRALLQSFLALVAQARTPSETSVEGSDSSPAPFLILQVQSWIREMSRLVREVGAEPRFFWRDDVPLGAGRRGLPPYFCRECGHSGWLSFMREGDTHLAEDPKIIYGHYFAKHRNMRYVYSVGPDTPGEGERRLTPERLCLHCLAVGYQPRCAICGRETLPVLIYHEVSSPGGVTQPRDLRRCPACGADNALSIVGRAAASLSSVAISHTYTSPLNDDKKLLAFTDSVQDASHHATFFAARTYRFSLRTAFQALLENSPDEAIRLDQFTQRLLDYWLPVWQAGAPPGGEARAGQKLVATLMPPDLRELAAYRQYVEGPPGPIPRDLDNDLRRRLSWEVTMEYGFNARVGRSLERVGSSAATLDPARLKAAVEKLALILPEEIGLLKGIDAAAVRHFLGGLLERTRTRGGVDHPLLRRYAEEHGDWFLLTKRRQPLLSPFYRNSPRFPRFLVDSSRRDVFDQFLTGGGRHTWYVDWVQRALSPALGIHDTNEVYRLVMPALIGEGLLCQYTRGRSCAYGLLPEALLVTRHTAAVRCDTCNQRQPVTPETEAQWLGRACLNYRCPGHYRPDAEGDQHYYRAIYERGQVERIFAREHTGLLQRSVREAIEIQFKDQTQADAPNLLAATPTLELGIDIGDLSATLACSVPPSTANYLQRIGRAGRRTGNSLVLALANVKPHDLYFFAQPLEMIAGAIVPPGCYLDAANMLRRQFLAFCMDTWTATDPAARQLPRTVKDMLARVNRGGFPEDLLAFYERHKASLIERFLGMFGGVLSAENQAQLRDLAAGDELPGMVRAAVARAVAEREELRAARRSLRAEQEKVEADPDRYQDPEEEIRNIEQDIRVVVQTIRQLEDKYILNFFTDAGLLPNYAFPETGVRLRSIITGLERPGDDGKGYEVKEYLRPAPLALRELAPFNTFYAEGRKVTIGYVDVGGRENVVERWQFCDRCSYMAPVSTSHYQSSCPACGSEVWRDLGQQHDMLRFREVSSRSDHRQSLTGDETEDRDKEAYQTGHFFEIHPEHSRGAHLIPGLPFGLEYLDQVTLREINFGLTEAWGQRVTIADEERPEVGYQVCPSCGAVHDPRQDEEHADQPQHLRTCTRHSGARSGSRPVEWHNLYFYRELTSEALRLLLPVSTVLVDEKLATFEACLDLGLRLKFRGDPGHLKILPHVEVAPDGTRRRFLVIYDAVPGGTGYLRDLAKPDEFRQVLQLALDRLLSCPCRLDPDRQACYRCLYSYQAQRALELISRQRGVEMLQEILGNWEALAAIESLSDAAMESVLESELEQRFVNALADYAGKTPGCTWRSRLHNGKLAWELAFDGGDGDRTSWLIEPQVFVGPGQGVQVPCKPDFVCWPQGPAQDRARPVAVFADGFTYHVRPHHAVGGLADDLRKRRALLQSGRFALWSVTWDDVEEFAEGHPLTLSPFDKDRYQFVDRALRRMASPLPASLLRANAVTQLVTHLRHPGAERWTELAAMTALAIMTPPRPPLAAGFLDGKASALQTEPVQPDLSVPAGAPSGDCLYGIVEKHELHLLIFAPQSAIQTQDAGRFAAVLRLDDVADHRAGEGFKHIWRQFLLLCNLLRPLAGLVPLTSEYVQEYALEEAAPEPPEEPVPEMPPVPAPWAEAFQYALPECRDLLRACLDTGAPVPTVGYELLDDLDRIAGMAELAWETQQVAVFLPDQEADVEAFARAGWRTFDLVDGDALLEVLSA